MSGIAGIYNLSGADADRQLLVRMLEEMAHRGPDGRGLFFDRALSLGQQLLKGLRETPASLPASIDDGALTLVYDGQIYNRPELQPDLERKGHVLRQSTDEEVVLHSYREWGYDCASRFNGVWAFAIWDRKKECLFCCRDRAGSKPFNYFFDGQRFIFASEKKAILKCPGVPRRVNEVQAHNYLMWGIFKNPGTTFFKDVHQLEAGHYAIVDKNGLHKKRWWNLVINTESTILSPEDTADSVKHFSFLLEDAVRIRIPGYRSRAALSLSGGLESSSIAAIAGGIYKEQPGDTLKTFSCCYENEPQDERKFIEPVLKLTGVQKNYVFPDAKNLWRDLPEIIRQHDEPPTVYSAFSRWCIMYAAKDQGIKVLFDGDGGDVALAGHAWAYCTYFIELARKGLSGNLFNEIAGSIRVIGAKDLGQLTGAVLAGLMLSHVDPSAQLKLRHVLFKLRHRRTDRIINPAFDSRTAFDGLDSLNRQYSLHSKGLNRFLGYWLSQFTWHPDNVAAPFQIEIATPFFDHRLVEFAFSLPPGMKIKNGWTKWILREAMKGKLPEEVRLRKHKNAFAAPLKSWLAANRENIIDLFSEDDSPGREYIDGRLIVKILDDMLESNKAAMELWRYISFELWLRRYF